MVQSGPANLPVWMESLNGNSSDKTSFHETVAKLEDFYQKINGTETLRFVVDSAFFNKEKLAQLDKVNWISRVPGNISEVKTYYASNDLTWHLTKDERYQIANCQAPEDYQRQRWLLVYSEPAYARAYKTWCNKMEKAYNKLVKDARHLSNHQYKCEADANNAVSKLFKQIKPYFLLDYKLTSEPYYKNKGRPKKDAVPTGYNYQLTIDIAYDIAKVKHEQNKLGKFMLATNELEANLSNEDILWQYKEQSSIESGFKFLKANDFEVSSVYLKSATRIGALMMLMTLTLLVYSFAEYHLRQCIAENKESLPNQQGKAIDNPTARWIFCLMSAITIVEINNGQQPQNIVTNVYPVHQKVIAYFGVQAKRIYGIPIELQPTDIKLNKKNWLMRRKGSDAARRSEPTNPR